MCIRDRYWAEELAKQTQDTEIANDFAPVAEKLRENEEKIAAELLAPQGSAGDIGGYYLPDDEKATATMRPSATLNEIIDSMVAR